MCSVITLSSEPGQMARFFRGLVDSRQCESRGVNLRAHGFLKTEVAPVVFGNPMGLPEIDYKHFSLCPSWSKVWPFKFDTYNARLARFKRAKESSDGNPGYVLDAQGLPVEEYIFSVPSFRDAFNAGQTCLVPLSGAVESCYFGLSAGQIVRFAPDKDSFLFAVGLWNDWKNVTTGEVVPTFTLLTDSPDPFVFSHGHDRGIIVLDPGAWQDWLFNRRMSGRQRLQFIRDNRIQPAWKAETERNLKEGWRRRAPTPTEIADIRVWHSKSSA